MSVTQRRAVCLALVATVVFRVPLMRLGDATDADNAISPLDVVASQLVLPVEHGANGAKRNKAQADGDPGDLVRALLYPGELGRSVLDAYACATDKKKVLARDGGDPADWKSAADVRKLKRLDARLNSVFGSKKTTLIAGSFSPWARRSRRRPREARGPPGVLGRRVALVARLRRRAVAPDVGLVIVLAMTYQSYRIAGAARGRARRSARRRSNACARRGGESQEEELTSAA